MTYREMTLSEELKMPTLKAAELEKSVIQSVLTNQSPVMKFWFIVMVMNLALFLFIIH